jgi:hypothetical protein
LFSLTRKRINAFAKGIGMFMKLAVLSALLFVSPWAQARSSRAESAQSLRTTYAYERTSAFNREDKSMLVTAQLLGTSVSPVPMMGINAGIYLTGDLIAQLEYGHGTLGLGFFDIRADTLGANLKLFTGNSFYFKGGLIYRQVYVDNVSCILCEDKTPRDAGSASSLGIEGAIGNQWQWETFTLGVDWLGVVAPVAVLKTENKYDSSSSKSESTKQEINEVWNDVAKAVNLSLLRFYLGASF